MAGLAGATGATGCGAGSGVGAAVPCCATGASGSVICEDSAAAISGALSPCVIPDVSAPGCCGLALSFGYSRSLRSPMGVAAVITSISGAGWLSAATPGAVMVISFAG